MPAVTAWLQPIATLEVISNTLHKKSSVTITPGSGKNADRSEFQWKFTDDQDRAWRGSAVGQATEEKGKFNLTLRLAQSK